MPDCLLLHAFHRQVEARLSMKGAQQLVFARLRSPRPKCVGFLSEGGEEGFKPTLRFTQIGKIYHLSQRLRIHGHGVSARNYEW